MTETPTDPPTSDELQQVLHILDRAREEIGKVIIGQQRVIDLMLIPIFSGHHALVEGVPGVAKTLLVRTLAEVLGVPFGRVQFTPDLMPSDITGTNVFNLQTNSFTLVKGPVFTSFLLGDEINRAPAKTQAALLQAMQERQVTIDRETHRLAPEFTVFATQNPVEFEGTYPLPEAQKDRFMLKINMSYPDHDDEMTLARRLLSDDAPEVMLERGVVQPVIEPGVLATMRRGLQGVRLREDMIAYVVRLVRATREHEAILVGAGPRATGALLEAARVAAAIEGRDYVTPDDVKDLAIAVMGHRIVLRPEYEIEGLTLDEVVQRILNEVPVPR